MRVPTLNGQQVSPQAQGPQYSQVNYQTPVATGAAIGEGLQHVAQGVGRVQEVWNNEQQANNHAQLASLVGEYQNGLNVGADGDKTKGIPGYLQQAGNDALKTLDPALQQLEKQRQDILAKAPNGQVREAFDLQSKKMWERTRDQFNQHATQQGLVAAQSDLNVVTSASLNALPSAYADPKARAELIAQPRAQIEAYAKLKGLDPRPAIQDFEAKAHGIVMEQYLLSDAPLQAQEYLAANRASLGAEAQKFEARIHLQVQQNQALANASKISSESRLGDTQWIDPAKAFAAVDAMPDGPLKEKTRNEVQQRVAQSNALRDQQGKDRLNQLDAMVAQGQSTHSPQGIAVRQWMMDPANGAAHLLRAFDEHQLDRQRSAETYARARANDADADARRAAADELARNNYRDKTALNEFLAKDPQELATLSDTDIRTMYLGRATDDGINVMLQRAHTFQQRNTSGKGMHDREFSAFLTQEGLKANLQGTPTSGQVQNYRSQMTVWAMEHRERTGKEPTLEEMKHQSAEMLDQVMIPRKWYQNNPEGFRFELQREPDFASAQSIPAEDQVLPENQTRFERGAPADIKIPPAPRESSSSGQGANGAPAIDTSPNVEHRDAYFAMPDGSRVLVKAPASAPAPAAAPGQGFTVPVVNSPQAVAHTWKATKQDYLGIAAALEAAGQKPTDANVKRALEALAARRGRK